MSEHLIQYSTLVDIGDAVREMTETSDEIPVKELASKIREIKTGVEVLKKSGTVSISSSGTTVTCEFKPDLVYLNLGTLSYNGTQYISAGFCFNEETRTNTIFCLVYNGSGSTTVTCSQSDTGFTVSSSSLSGSYSYTAVKYTE